MPLWGDKPEVQINEQEITELVATAGKFPAIEQSAKDLAKKYEIVQSSETIVKDLEAKCLVLEGKKAGLKTLKQEVADKIDEVKASLKTEQTKANAAAEIERRKNEQSALLSNINEQTGKIREIYAKIDKTYHDFEKVYDVSYKKHEYSRFHIGAKDPAKEKYQNAFAALKKLFEGIKVSYDNLKTSDPVKLAEYKETIIKNKESFDNAAGELKDLEGPALAAIDDKEMKKLTKAGGDGSLNLNFSVTFLVIAAVLILILLFLHFHLRKHSKRVEYETVSCNSDGGSDEWY